MNRLISRFAIWLILLCIGIGAKASNVITISSTEGAPGDEVTVSIGLENSDAVSTLQLSIPLDENLTLVTGSGQLGSRCSSHSLTVGVKDGVLNVFIYSLSMAAITGNDGEVANFKLKLGNQPATIALTPTKTVLTNTDGQTVDASANSGEVTIRCAKAQYSTMEVDFGEVPIRSIYQQTVTVTNVGNADLTVTGLTFSDVNVFSSTTALPITVGAGASRELNITYAPVERGSISKTLKVECNSISKLNTIALKAQPFAVNELHVQDASGISDEEVTVKMTMNNMDAISGYQVEFDLPEQFEYVDNSFTLSSRKQDHIGMATINGSKLRIIAYSSNDLSFTGDDGEIGLFKVKLVGRYGTMLTPTKTVLSATIDNKVENVVSAVYGGNITISSPQISCDGSLDFGVVSVTDSCEKTFTIRNYGNAPLTINRLTFDNEALSIKEILPLVVPSYSNTVITVVYSSVEQKSFEATMHIYSNDPDQRLKTVAVSGSRFAPNYVAMRTPKTYVDENAKVEFDLNVYDAVSGFQFDLTYPSQYYEVYDGNVVAVDRAQGMTATYREIDAQTVRYFCYFLNGQNVPAGNGQVMTILLRPKNGSAPVGTYQVTMKNVKIGTNELMDKYAGTDLVSSFQVKQYRVMVTANSYTRVYGDDNPTFEYTSEGETILGQPEFSCEATATSPVGEYPIFVTQGSLENEDVKYISGTLTITKAPLTITAGSYTKKQYNPMPEFTLSYKGFKNNETEDVLTKKAIISCDANEDSAPGEYNITLSGAEAANYDITYVAGKLTINEPDSYTLTYLVDGEVYQSFSIKYRDVITPLPAPEKEGYTFSGWSEIPATMPTHDVIVTGTFKINKYLLTYKVDDEVFKSDSIVYNTTLTPEANPTKEGYTFSGWSEIPNTMPAHDVIVTGTFTINKYKLTYMIDDKVYKDTVYEYSATIVPEPMPEGNYATFEWIDLPETMPAHDVVVHASYTTGIRAMILSKPQDVQIYSPNGKKLNKLQKGLNLVLMRDGTIRKIVIK